MELIGRLILALVLAVAAVGKLARPRESAAAMTAFGFRSAGGRWLAFAVAVGAELVLAVAVAAGSERAAWAAAALMALYALTMLGALLRGRVGEPCGCFGAESRIGWGAIARNAVLAAGFAALPLLSG